MSAKYERIKQSDLALPTPLRWLTRAFSSIRMAVTLMVLVILYGTIASVPIFYLAVGGLYLLVGIGTLGPAVLLIGLAARLTRPMPTAGRALVLLVSGAALLLAGGWFCYDISIEAGRWLAHLPAFAGHKGDTIRRLPWFEMTTIEFYTWWPMKLILILFVLNLIWATIRRIEFKFMNLGVLTVHTGIVVIAVGSIIYGTYKVEGDALLKRDDLGGGYVATFYDADMPALYIARGRSGRAGRFMVPLPQLPRYNDYPMGSMNIALHEKRYFDKLLPGNLKMTIPGFFAYANLESTWQPASQSKTVPANAQTSPGLRLRLGPRNLPNAGEYPPGAGPTAAGASKMLLARVPADRVLERSGWAVEYLLQPGEQRIRDLTAEFQGRHGLVVRVPGQNVRKVYAIQPGQTIQVGDTGYTLKVQAIGPYPMPFATPGYKGAGDSRARIQVTGHGKQFKRIVMHRYPERSQDFVPAPNDPDAPPMGRRKAPDPAIELTYLDNSKTQFHLISPKAGSDRLTLITRRAGGEAFKTALPKDRFYLGARRGGAPQWVHITERYPRMVKRRQPVPVPDDQRKPKHEGQYTRALLPVRLTLERPPSEGGDWQRTLWLSQMKYPTEPMGRHRPKHVTVPGVGTIKLTFSRQRRSLPFAMQLRAFKMTPYRGTTIPQEYKSTLAIVDLGPDGRPRGEPAIRESHMNNPVIYYPDNASFQLSKVKLSQNGWDPPQPSEPNPRAKNAQGEFINQQTYTILGVSNNVAIRVIFVGGVLIAVGVPWAFFVKPWLLQWHKRKWQARYQQTGSDQAASDQAPDLAKMPNALGTSGQPGASGTDESTDPAEQREPAGTRS